MSLPSLRRQPGQAPQPEPLGFVVAFERAGRIVLPNTDVTDEETARGEADRWASHERASGVITPRKCRVCAVIPLEEL